MKKHFLTLLLVLTVGTSTMLADTAEPGWRVFTNPNGEQIEYELRGDEFYHYMIDREGNFLELDDDGFLRIKEKASDELIRQRRASSKMLKNAIIRRTPGNVNLAPRGLFILVNYQDTKYQSSNSLAEMTAMINSVGHTYNFEGAPGSVRDYFLDQSNGNYDPQFDVYGPVTVSQTSAYYTGNGKYDKGYEMIIEACQALDDQVDFSQYDNDNDGFIDFVYILYAGKGQSDGGGATTIWPHQGMIYTWNNKTVILDDKKLDVYACSGELHGRSGDHRNGIGIICHEFSHVLGLPDYYDTNYGPNYKYKRTPRSWHLMDSGDHCNNNITPVNYAVHDKYYLGWVTPTALNDPEYVTLPADGKNYRMLNSAGSYSPTTSNTTYYFENRQKTGWDKYLPGSGLLVWKVTYNQNLWTSNKPNRSDSTTTNLSYVIVSASGGDSCLNSGADSYPGTQGITSVTPISGKALTDITKSNGKINFKFRGGTTKKYNLWICGTQITSSNCNNIGSIQGVVSAGSGTQYSEETNTLTLDNVSISLTPYNILNYGIQSTIPDLKIEVLGNCHIVGAVNWSCIRLNENATITGGGKLVLDATNEGFGLFLRADATNYAHRNLTLTVKDVTVDALGQCGIGGTTRSDYSYGAVLVVDNAIITANTNGCAPATAASIGRLHNLDLTTYNTCKISKPDGLTGFLLDSAAVVTYNNDAEDFERVRSEVKIEPRTYDLYVGGVQINGSNHNHITGTGISGNVAFDPATNTLTLNNFSYSGANEGIKTNLSSLLSVSTLKIVLIGNNTITCSGSDGIWSNDYLRISGTGSLIVKSTAAEGNGLYIKTASVTKRNLTISGGADVTFISSHAVGMRGGSGKLTVDNSTVTATGATSSTKGWQTLEKVNVEIISPIGATFSSGGIYLNGELTNSTVKIGPVTYYNLRICGTRIHSGNCTDITAAVDGITGIVSYNPTTNTLSLTNATLTTPDVTQAIWTQIPDLKIEVNGTCDLNTPYCIALRIDASTTIVGQGTDALLKVHNAGPLDHAIGSIAAGMCYIALTTFNNADLTINNCSVETEGAGGVLLQGTSQLTINRSHLTALSIGVPTSDAQRKVMRSFKANVEPVLNFCELVAPIGGYFSSSLGGYTTDGTNLTRELVEFDITPCTNKNVEFSIETEDPYTWNGTVYNANGDYVRTFQMANGCDSIVTLHLTILTPTQKWTNGILPGKFSISDQKQVLFSQGNLQYMSYTDKWRFAQNQYDTIGNNNKNIADNYIGWIDLFGWGTGNIPTKTSTSNDDYANFIDWGENTIVNSGNATDLWRTLTNDEWYHLFHLRTNATNLFGLGCVNGINGIILLPDDWTCPADLTFTASTTLGLEGGNGTTFFNDTDNDHFEDNIYTPGQWTTMEEAGAVFLPAAGYRRYGTKVQSVNTYGYYWSAANSTNTSLAYDLYFHTHGLYAYSITSRNYGCSVRLVHETIKETPTAIDNVSADAAVQKIFINGQILILRGNKTYTTDGRLVR